jgi:hypothetical protein
MVSQSRSVSNALEGATQNPQQQQPTPAEAQVQQSVGLQGEPSPQDVQQFLP